MRAVAELAHGARTCRPRARAGGPRARRVSEAERRHAPGPDLLLEGACRHAGGHARERADPARRRARRHGGARGADYPRVAPCRPQRGAGRGAAAGRQPFAADVDGRRRDGRGAREADAGGRCGPATGAGGRVRRGAARAGGGRLRSGRDGRHGRRYGRAADARAAAGGRHRGGGRRGADRRTRQGHRRRPVSGGAACRRSGAGGTARRSRGNAGEDGTQRTPAPDDWAVSGCTPRAIRTRRTVRVQPDRARRGGRHSRLRGDRPARGVRRRHGHDAPRARRRDPRRRPPHAHPLARPPPGAVGPRPAVSLPRLRQPPLRCPSHRALGRRRPTALDNLVLLCRRHHRAVHEEGFRVTLDAVRGVQFLRPDGRPLAAAPPAPDWDGPALDPANDRLAAAGIAIDARTATPAWQGERLDLDWAISVLWRPRRERSAE